MTAPQLSVDTVSKSVSNITVTQKVQSVNISISENFENDTEKNSIAVLSADELLDKYDQGEITRRKIGDGSKPLKSPFFSGFGRPPRH